MRDFDKAIHDAHVRQYRSARLFTGWMAFVLAGMALGMMWGVWVMGGGV